MEGMSKENVFPVRRRGISIFGWSLITLAVLMCLVSVFSAPPFTPKLVVSVIGLLAFGVYFLIRARNVREIRIDDRTIRFLPVGTEVLLSEIEGMRVPSWMDRHDNPPNALKALPLVTITKRTRLVPGAVLEVDGTCRLDLFGSQSDVVLASLEERILRVN